MKNQFIITLLCLSMIGNLAMAQTKKPTTTTKKPSTTVKSTAPKTTTKTSTTTTTTSPSSTTAPVVVEEKKTTTTTTSTGSSSNINSSNTSSSTTIQQSSGPSKGAKKTADPKPEKVKEPKPERVREPKPEKIRTSSSGDVGTHFGIKAGVNSLFFLSSSKIQGGTPDFSIGFHGGIVGNFGLSETIAIQAEALYVQQSAKFSNGADNATFVGNGVEIPLALQFNFGGDTKIFINAGGYATYTLGGSYSGVSGGVTVPSKTIDYTGVSFGDRTDYGAILGLGVKFNQALFVEARANYSVKDGSYTDAAGKKVVPIFAGLSLGYFF
jgi:Outer membrane protein beta-barrel domain